MIIQPTNKSKYLSLIIIFLFYATFGLLSYLPSALNNEVNSNTFTISQSLAFSIKPAVVIVLLLSFILYGYLIFYRGHNYLWIRIFLLFAIYSLIVTLLWVTTFYNQTDHYIIAAFIFILSTLLIMLNNFVLYNGIKVHNKYKTIFIVSIPILGILGLIGLVISNSLKVNPMFASFENYMLFIEGLSILALGFI